MSKIFTATNKGEEQYFVCGETELLNIGSRVPEGTEVREEELSIKWQYLSGDGESWIEYQLWHGATVEDAKNYYPHLTFRQVATLKAKAEPEQISELEAPHHFEILASDNNWVKISCRPEQGQRMHLDPNLPFKIRKVYEDEVSVSPLKDREQSFTVDDLRKAWSDGWQQNTNDKYDDTGKTFDEFLANIQVKDREHDNELYFEVAEIASKHLVFNKQGKGIGEIPDSKTVKDKELFEASKERWHFDALQFIREIKKEGYSITRK